MIVRSKRGRLSILAVTAVAATAFALGHASASTRGHVYTGRPGDTFRVPGAATRCTVSTEAGNTCVTVPGPGQTPGSHKGDHVRIASLTGWYASNWDRTRRIIHG